MRELKFRAWNNKDKEMIHLENSGLQYYDFEGNYSLGFTVDSYSAFWSHEQYATQSKEANKFPLMQYIGLIDYNGKEIYEGDIVKVDANYGGDYFYEECFAVVVYEESGFTLDKANTKDGFVWQCFNWIELEVVGNIYENLELLERQHETYNGM